MWRYIYIYIALAASILGAPLPEWRGYCKLDDGPIYSLYDPTTKKAIWARIGDKHFGYNLLSGASKFLLIEDQSGGRHKLELSGASLKSSNSLPPLSRQEAISWVRAQIKAFMSADLRQLHTEELSIAEKRKIDELTASAQAQAKNTEKILELNAQSKPPEPVHEVVEILNEQQGSVPLSKGIRNGAPHTVAFRAMTLDSLPGFVRANLKQEDLNSLLSEQAAMMEKAAEAILKKE